MGFLFMFSPSPCTLRLSCRTHRRDDCCDLNCVGAVECVQWECLFESPTRTPGKVDSWWTFTGFPMKPRNAAFNKHANRCTCRHSMARMLVYIKFDHFYLTTLDSGFPMVSLFFGTQWQQWQQWQAIHFADSRAIFNPKLEQKRITRCHGMGLTGAEFVVAHKIGTDFYNLKTS